LPGLFMQIDKSCVTRRRPEAIMASVLALAAVLAMQPGAEAFAADTSPQAGDSRAAVVTSPGNADTGGLARAPSMGPASPDVRYMADWVARSGDNAGMPYVIVDKVNATVFVMDADGRLAGAAPALLGIALGDGSAAGLGDRKMSAIRLDERTTPAGRFVASLGQDLHGQDILWIDYENAIALHRVVKGTPAEDRARRLQSATPDDNRISYGCINVPVEFYEKVVHPVFATTSGVVYILPETSGVRDAYGPPVSGGKTDGGGERDAAVPGGGAAR
jgi:hypothetical protein